jgi:putative toxin-antitoxin system antitoxin component (TIGR02293 family)
MYQLSMPRKTVTHRVAKRQPLSTKESAKAVRVARITAFAERAFRDPEKAGTGCENANRASMVTPIEMLATEAGARLVEETIIQLEHFMLA